MALSTDETIDTLNGLIETCRDGEEGFRTAGESIEDPELHSQFRSYSRQRGEFVYELQQIVKRLGGDPEKSGSFASSLHRGWINIQSAVTGHDSHEIIEECEAGEDAAVNNYRDALAKDLPADIHDTVQKQFEQIKESHDHLSTLKHSTQKP